MHRNYFIAVCSEYVTVSEKIWHSTQNVRYLSFLLAQERERYVMYAGRHALSKTRRK